MKLTTRHFFHFAPIVGVRSKTLLAALLACLTLLWSTPVMATPIFYTNRPDFESACLAAAISLTHDNYNEGFYGDGTDTSLGTPIFDQLSFPRTGYTVSRTDGHLDWDEVTAAPSISEVGGPHMMSVDVDGHAADGTTPFVFSFNSTMNAFGIDTFGFGSGIDDPNTPYDLTLTVSGIDQVFATGPIYGPGGVPPNKTWFFLGVIDSAGFNTLEILGGGWRDGVELDNLAYGSASPVPEPATVLLLGTGLVGLVGLRKKLKK